MPCILLEWRRHSPTKKSEIPLEAQVSLVRPGCIFLSRNRILSLNRPRSSGDRAAIILKIVKKTYETGAFKKETQIFFFIFFLFNLCILFFRDLDFFYFILILRQKIS